MPLSSISLCARALVKLGATPISSFADAISEAKIADLLYPVVRDSLLSAHPWNFATAQVRLPQLAAPPMADFTYAFQLPIDFLRALSAGSGVSGRGLEYRIIKDRLHSDSDRVMLSYISRPNEALFPAYFEALLINRLAAEFCLPVTENTSRAEFFHKLAKDEFQQAKLLDSQQDMAPRIEDFPLITARHS